MREVGQGIGTGRVAGHEYYGRTEVTAAPGLVTKQQGG